MSLRDFWINVEVCIGLNSQLPMKKILTNPAVIFICTLLQYFSDHFSIPGFKNKPAV